jgi:hypothetical protein
MPLGWHVKSIGACDHHHRCHQKALQIELLDWGHQVHLEVIIGGRFLRADRDPGLGGDGATVGSAGRSMLAWIVGMKLQKRVATKSSIATCAVLLKGKGTDQKAAQRKQIAGGPVVRFGGTLFLATVYGSREVCSPDRRYISRGCTCWGDSELQRQESSRSYWRLLGSWQMECPADRPNGVPKIYQLGAAQVRSYHSVVQGQTHILAFYCYSKLYCSLPSLLPRPTSTSYHYCH